MDFETLEKVEAVAAKGRELADKIHSVNDIIATLSNNSIIEISFDASSMAWVSAISEPALVSKCVDAVMLVLKECSETLEKEFFELNICCIKSEEKHASEELCPECRTPLTISSTGHVTYKCYKCNWFECGQIPCSICPERGLCDDYS